MLNSIPHSWSVWMIRLVAIVIVQCNAITKAEELESLQVHGFLSQGYIKTTDNNDFFGNSSEDGSFRFRELGLNASLRPLSNLQVSAQILSRTAGKGNKGGIRVDYGFLDYTIVSDEAKQAGFRLGRMKNPLGFYNDTRDVPFTRPSILLPQSIYFDRTRNLALAADGAQLYGESRHEFGDFFIQIGTGFPIVNNRDTMAAVLGGPASGDLTTKPSYIGRIMYEREGGRLRLAVSGANVNVGYDPSIRDQLQSGNVQFSPLIFSAQYNAERWSLTSEYALRFFKIKNFGTPALNQSFLGESFYFQGIYRFTPKWEAVLRYDVLFTDREDRDGRRFAAKSAEYGRASPAYSRFAKDITVGLRWNITPELMLSTEYHRVNGTAWLSTLDNPDPMNTDKDWNLFAAQISYRF